MLEFSNAVNALHLCGVGKAHLGRRGRRDLNASPLDSTVQIQSIQQSLACRDFVALVSHRFDAQGPSAASVDGSHQLSASTATQRLAIRDDLIATLTVQAGLLLGPDGLLKFQNRHRFEHPLNAVLRRHFILFGSPVEPTSKGGSLRRSQILGEENDAPVISPSLGQ